MCRFAASAKMPSSPGWRLPKQVNTGGRLRMPWGVTLGKWSWCLRIPLSHCWLRKRAWQKSRCQTPAWRGRHGTQSTRRRIGELRRRPLASISSVGSTTLRMDGNLPRTASWPLVACPWAQLSACAQCVAKIVVPDSAQIRPMWRDSPWAHAACSLRLEPVRADAAGSAVVLPVRFDVVMARCVVGTSALQEPLWNLAQRLDVQDATQRSLELHTASVPVHIQVVSKGRRHQKCVPSAVGRKRGHADSMRDLGLHLLRRGQLVHGVPVLGGGDGQRRPQAGQEVQCNWRRRQAWPPLWLVLKASLPCLRAHVDCHFAIPTWFPDPRDVQQ